MFSPWATPFVNDQSLVKADFLNWVRINLFSAIDGAGGSNGVPYTPVTKLIIAGEGVEIRGAAFSLTKLGGDGGDLVVEGSATIGETLTLNNPTATDPTIDMPTAPAASNRRLLLRAPYHPSSTFRGRVYATAEGLVGLEVATNAVWSGAQWSTEQSITGNMLATFGLGKLSLRSQSASASPWTTWDRELHLDPRPVTGTAPARTLSPSNIPVAHGKITSDGSGGITLVSDYGAASVNVVSGDAVVTLDQPMADTNYTVIVTSADFNNHDAVVARPTTNVTFTARAVYNNAGTSLQRSLASNPRTFTFAVFGLQA